MSHVAHMIASCHTHMALLDFGAKATSYAWVTLHIHMNESWRTWVTLHIHTNESWRTWVTLHTCERVMAYMSHVAHTYERVMAHTSHVIHMWTSHGTNESRHTYERVMARAGALLDYVVKGLGMPKEQGGLVAAEALQVCIIYIIYIHIYVYTYIYLKIYKLCPRSRLGLFPPRR